MSIEGKHIYKLVSSGSRDSVKLLYNAYGKKLYLYGIHTWKLDEDECWELVYKTLYKVLDSTRNYSFETDEKYGSFIFKIFINFLRNHYRDNQKRQEEFKLVPMDGIDRSDDNPQDPEKESAYMQSLNIELDKMEDWERILLLMRGQEMPYSVISQYVDKPESQLKVYYQRLKDRLIKAININLSGKEADDAR